MTKVLIVDDSALVRRVLGDILKSADFEVAVARDGAEALRAIHVFQPDVITLDVQMPGMDGLACLDRIMVERPCPVVMVSSLTKDGAETTLTALDLGAVGYVPKPDRTMSLAVDALAPMLIETVTAASKAKVRRAHRLVERLKARRVASPPTTGRPAKGGEPKGPAQEPPGLVLIGASTGGPTALEVVLTSLPADLPWPVLVAQHMPATFTGSLAARLDGLCDLSVVEVARPTVVQAGVVYIARGDADMIISRRSDVLVAMPAPSSPNHRWHPSVDRLVISAQAHVSPDRLIGVLMTGMGNDGAAAIAQMRAAGGRTIAEAERTAVVWGMPGELVRAGGAEFVEDLDDIPGRLTQMLSR